MQLIESARSMLQRRSSNKVFDEEDVLQNVFFSLFQQAEKGKFPDLDNRDDLWRLLIVMTERRVISNIRDAKAKKRGGGKPNVSINSTSHSMSQLNLEIPDSPQPAPETTEELIKTIDETLGNCGDLEREIVFLRMQDYTIEEITDKVSISAATVSRKLRYLKKRLQFEMDE